MERPNDKIHWLPEAEYQKARGQLSLQFNGVFFPFNGYGLHVFIPSAIVESVKL